MKVALRVVVLLLGIGLSIASAILEVLDPPGEGILNVFVQVEGSPDRVFEGARFDIQRIDVVLLAAGEEEEEVITITDDPLEFIIPNQSFGVPILLAQASIPIGQVRQVRLIVGDASVRESSEQQVITFDVVVPSGQQTGLKAVPRSGEDVSVIESETTRALVVIDLDTQLIEPPGRGLLLKPVSKLEQLDRQAVHDFLEPTEALITVGTSTYPETGVILERAKALDITTGRVRDVVIDSTGTPRDVDDVREAEQAAYRAVHGSLQRALLNELASFAPGSLLTVEIFVDTPPAAPFVPSDAALTSLALRDAEHADYQADLAEENQPLVDAVIAHLVGAGVEVESRSDVAGSVVATATRETVQDVIALIPGVLAVDRQRPARPIAFSGALDLVENAIFPTYETIGTPSNVRIVVEERGCAKVDHAVFDLAEREPNDPVGGEITNHATRVMSIAAGFDAPDHAGAYRSRLKSVCGGGDARQRAFAANPDVLNNSFVTFARPTADHAERDRAVFGSRVVLVRGSSQTSVSPDGIARCYEYNAICVGGYGLAPVGEPATFGVDLITGETQFADDIPFATQNYLNLDLNVDGTAGLAREQPLLTAKALNVRAATAFPFNFSTESGTSFSGPAVGGLAGLLMSVEPSLVREPTAVRALLMASAKHNITGRLVPDFTDDIDDRDGAGAPRADRALIILASGQLEFGILDRDTDFDASGEFTIRFAATAGQRARVALTWDVCPYITELDSYDHLTIDLDLSVRGITGDFDFVKANPSAVDNYEIIDFTVPKTGEWTIVVQPQRWSGCKELQVFSVAEGDLFPVGTRRTFFAIAWDVGPLLE